MMMQASDPIARPVKLSLTDIQSAARASTRLTMPVDAQLVLGAQVSCPRQLPSDWVDHLGLRERAARRAAAGSTVRTSTTSP